MRGSNSDNDCYVFVGLFSLVNGGGERGETAMIGPPAVSLAGIKWPSIEC